MPQAHVVGSINMDIVAFVDRHPTPGETVIGRRAGYFPGGKGANQAVAIARLGGRVAMHGRVGDDAFGARMRAFLAEEGVESSGVAVAAGSTTGIALITVDRNSENAITVVPGANHAWVAAPALACEAGDIVICQLEVPISIVAAAFDAAKARGAMTILNPAPFQAVPDAVLACCDILVLNEVELRQMTAAVLDPADPNSVTAAAAGIRAKGPRTIVVTLGAEGAHIAGTTGGVRIPGLPVAAVDTTGAGDCFVGALAAELLRGRDVEAAARFANRAAASSVTREGAAVSIPRLSELAGDGSGRKKPLHCDDDGKD